MGYKRQFLLQGFISQEQALGRSHEMAIDAGYKEDASTKYLVGTTQIGINNWALIIEEEYLKFLNDAERTSIMLNEIPKPLPEIKYYAPTVFRFMPKKFVDDFFNEGKLKIGSFSKFRKNEDKQKGDKQEGRSMLFGESNEKSFISFTSHGHDAFVLCSTLRCDTEIMNDFESDDGIVITNPADFAIAISEVIPEFKAVLLGPCRYQIDKSIQRNVPDFSIESLAVSETDSNTDLNKLFAMANSVGGDDVFFTKTHHHNHQHEYRFVWITWDSQVPDSIDIVCPNARNFCRRLNPLDISL